MVTAVVVLVVVVGLGALLARGVRRRRQGWYGDEAGPTADARGAVNRNSWVLGGGGGGGGG
ncbi:hypothetical protein [Klenkia sp. PcliD-1-E]|uniref:hypothetical protein n=1 Tax=Klenkia sp. PcliD-1-E TaxID=2954492 RepID=UPI0020977610|nr:hypothetical protein [Klenkia sp. PcliD-1-E]MCO7220099.1 hypothetical protein [Klenkia sp. PcliD-1-E]